MKTVLVIPTFNEAGNLSQLAERIFVLGIADLNLLIVDDASPDGCGDVADSLHQKYGDQFKVIHQPQRMGYAPSTLRGIEAALKDGADVVGIMDADLSHPPEKLLEMIKALDAADIVVGSRYVAGGSTDPNWSLGRKALSSFSNLYTRTILGLPIKDTTGSFRLWKRQALESIPYATAHSQGFFIIVEMAYLATLAGLTFAEVPILYTERKIGSSKMSLRLQLEAASRVWQLRRIYRKSF